MTRSNDSPTPALYFEVHVTVDPFFGKMREHLEKIAAQHGFRLAKLFMSKGEEHQEDTFMTSRGTDYNDMRHRTIALVTSLNRMGFPVRRYKLENTLVDSKAKGAMGGDLWEILR